MALKRGVRIGLAVAALLFAGSAALWFHFSPTQQTMRSAREISGFDLGRGTAVVGVRESPEAFNVGWYALYVLRLDKEAMAEATGIAPALGYRPIPRDGLYSHVRIAGVPNARSGWYALDRIRERHGDDIVVLDEAEGMLYVWQVH